MLPINFSSQVKFFNSQIENNCKISPELSKLFFVCLRKHFTKRLESKESERLANIQANVQATTPVLAKLVQTFIFKDSCPFQHLPIEIQQHIIEYLDLDDIHHLNCFLVNPPLQKIVWQNSRDVPFSLLELSIQSTSDIKDHIRKLNLKNSSNLYLLSIAVHITALKIYDGINEKLKILSRDNHYSSLTTLKISHFDTRTLSIISESYLSIRLKSLRLKQVIHIDHIRNFKSLHTLDLSTCLISGKDLQSLFTNNPIHHLETLRLNRCGINSQSFPVITAQPFTRLKSLRLDDNSLSGSDIDTVCRSTILTNLTELSLVGNGARLDMDLSTLTLLKVLNVSRNISFAAKFSLNQFCLTDVNLSHTYTSPIFLRHFLSDDSHCFLRKLNIAGLRILPDCIEAILEKGITTRLEELNLSENLLTDSHAKMIANSTNLKNLTSLNFSKNKLTIAGINGLLFSTNLQNLFRLDVRDNNFFDVPKTYKNSFLKLVINN